MNLKSRLSQLQTQAGAGADSPSSNTTVSDLRARIAQLEKRRPPVGAPSSGAIDSGSNRGQGPYMPGTGAPTDELIKAIEGEQIDDGLIRIHKRYPLNGKLGSIDSNILRNKPCLPGETGNAHRNVYIDTETTGLSGGSGTLAFLVGIAVVEADAIELTQFLMTGFSTEAASLKAFAECLTPDDQLVSYNGKSYDLPLLITRFRMQGMQHPFDGLPHLDLLHPVRRLFGKRWDDCRLITVEEKLLGFNRIDDLPGSEAPEAWFAYVRSGNAKNLVKVVEHNQQDILSLAVAHSMLTEAIEQPRVFDVDFYALARWLSEYNEDHARELLLSHADGLCDDGQRLLGHLLRRSGQWSQATTIWENLAARGCTDSMERLAKYHEHISKDLAAARRCCNSLPVNAAQQHRRKRIETKLGMTSRP